MAFIKIEDGCDRFCTYCTIPNIRGRYVSKPFDAIMDEASRLADSGVRELVLIAQETTFWGKDLYGAPDLKRLLAALKEKGYKYEILFMDASDEVLIKRYKETRRQHPVAPGGRVEDGIAKERKILEQIKKDADYVIDTSGLLTRVLKEELIRIFVKDENYNSLMISIMSFGFKNGIPADADLVFDVRFLPNPFYVESLKKLTGNDKPVRDYVMSFPEAEQFMEKLEDMISFLIPGYVKEGKNQLVIAIGCTGGQHRSVTIANALAERLRGGDYGINLYHRDAKH